MLLKSDRRRWALAGIATLAVIGTCLAPAAQAGENDKPPKEKAKAAALAEVWRTDFDGAAGSLPSGDDWIIDKGHNYPGGPSNWGTGEIQESTDSPENLQLDGDGHLKITALKNGENWTSGRIETKRTDFAAPEGGVMRIEAGLKLPDVSGDAALGYWPAFWTLGDAYRGNYQNWPGVGEFDIMENVNGQNTTHGVLHCGVNPGGPCNETTGIGKARECAGDCKADFHEYALELDRSGGTEELRWFVDGEQFHSVKETDMDARTWTDATGHGHFVLLNLAMGGAFPDGVAGTRTPTAATESGHSLSVDYVSVESTGGASK
ncbi:MAG TPA: glycoside hydrolase family 16 protein [Streptomyces sp.]|nr:glycoside hydrolase family 16 protein [Streptomyces sp.]